MNFGLIFSKLGDSELYCNPPRRRLAAPVRASHESIDARVIVPIMTLGRRLRRISRENQDWIAASSGNAGETLGAVQTVQAFTHEVQSRSVFSDMTETHAIFPLQPSRSRQRLTFFFSSRKSFQATSCVNSVTQLNL